MTNALLDEEFLLQIEELKKEFLNNLRYEFEDWESNVVKLEKPDNRDELLLELVRQVHSLKGTAGTYNVGIMTTICHKFEEVLETLTIKKPKNIQIEIDLCLKYIDSLKNILDIELSDDSPYDREQKYQQIWKNIDNTDSQKTKKILMVSGSKLILNFLKHDTSLEKSGISLKIDYYKDGYVALGEALKFPYDFIIVDNQLDQINGIPLISTIKQTAKKKDIFTILLTSSDKLNSQGLPKELLPDLCLNKDKSSLEKLKQTINC